MIKKAKYNTFYLNLKAETITNESDIDNVFELICTIIISNIKNLQEKLQTGLLIQSQINHDIDISKCNPLAGSSYTKIPKELDHPRKRQMNTQNIDDNECFKQCLVRYFHPAVNNPRRITKTDNDFTKELDFKDIISTENQRHSQKAFLVMKKR